jgi:hypothetical protein
MPAERRELFDRWLPPPVAERDVRRLAFMVGSVIEADPKWAMRWLHRLVPEGRKSISKDTRQHLAASLFTEAHQHSVPVALEQQRPIEALRLYAVFWDIATDQASSVPEVARARLAKAILSFTPPQDSGVPREGQTELVSRIWSEVANWPAVLRQEFESTFPSPQTPPAASASRDINPPPPRDTPASATVAIESVSPSPVHTAASSGALGPAVSQVLAPANTATDQRPLLPTTGSLQDSQSHLASVASQLQTILPTLQAVHAALGHHAIERENLNTQLLGAERALADIRDRLRAVEQTRDAAQAESADQRDRLQAVSSQLTQLTHDSELERRKLSQQIAANASGRIDEYKNRLALALSRLVVDLPNKQDTVTEALGRVVLLQFHQFLDALRQEGIDVRRGGDPR